MTRPSLLAAVALASLASAAHAQLALSVLTGATETPVVSLYDLGTVASGDTASAHFRLRNTGNSTATVTLLAVGGSGFTLATAPSLPFTLTASAAADFTVAFQAVVSGGYSATLRSDGISVLLTASVVPALTYRVQTPSGTQTLGAAPVDFGSAPVGQPQLRHFLIDNLALQALTVPSISVSGSDFSLSGASPTGSILQAGKEAAFDVQFRPVSAGVRTGTLTIGGKSYGLTGTANALPLPAPQLTITLPQAQSAQQGSITVRFTTLAATGGSGTVTLQFQPSVPGAQDPSVAFASGGQSVPFTFSAGDIQATFGTQRSAAFQTGTTAGTITFTAQLGSASDQRSVTIAPAAATVTAQALRAPGSVQVQLTGFDNTRTAGRLSFTFFDTASNTIAPGAIPADGTSAFAQYFSSSSVGGSFVLRAVFPVTGEVLAIQYVESSVTNSAGTTTTTRTSF